MSDSASTAERWLPVPGYEGLYDVSDQGRVRSWRTGRGAAARLGSEPRVLVLLPGRYPNVVLCQLGGARRTWTVHRLVALAFLGAPQSGHEVRHLNGDTHDCRLDNLAYGTSAENKRDTVRLGRAWYQRPDVMQRRLVAFRRTMRRNQVA